MVLSDSDNNTPCGLVDVSECYQEKRGYLAGHNKALADTKSVCLDDDCSPIESPPTNPPLVHKVVGDERRIVFLNEPVDIPTTSNDTRQITEVVSSLDVKERQVRAEQNRLNALEILQKTFSTSRLAPPSKPACPTTSTSTANHSNVSMEITSVVHLRQDNVIARPPPATK